MEHNHFTRRELNSELRKLYPNLTDEELLEAEENFDRYLELMLRVYERICGDPVAYAESQQSPREQRAQEDQENREN